MGQIDYITNWQKALIDWQAQNEGLDIESLQVINVLPSLIL